MACVNACPDTAILATAQPRAALDASIDGFCAAQPDPSGASVETCTGSSCAPRSTPPCLERKGIEPAQFGIFVDPIHCKGCGECVEVCAHLGHDALRMIDKEPATETTRLDARHVPHARSSFFRSLPPTPAVYRNDKALADLMLGEHALRLRRRCRVVLGLRRGHRAAHARRRDAPGPRPGVDGHRRRHRLQHGLRQHLPVQPVRRAVDELAVRERPDRRDGHPRAMGPGGHAERRLWAIGGDGAMYDIGFQALSRMVASGMDIKVMVLDTQVYSNTGGQASTASFSGQITKMSAFGRELHGRPERRKEIAQILMAHGEVYVAQTTTAHINHFYRAVMDANEFPGPAVIVVYTTCQPEHGIGDDTAAAQSRLAVDSRAFPLFTYDPRRGASLAERLSLQGNPALRDDWYRQPDGTPLDFVAFARTEGRFAPHFAADGDGERRDQGDRS